MKRNLTKLAFDALFIGLCLWLAWQLTGCAALSTNGGIIREANQRGLFDRVSVQVDTMVRVEQVYRIDTVFEGTTDYHLDTTLISECFDTIRINTILRVPYRIAYRDTITLVDTIEVAFEKQVPCLEAESKTDWTPWIILAVVCAVLLFYGWLKRR